MGGPAHIVLRIVDVLVDVSTRSRAMSVSLLRYIKEHAQERLRMGNHDRRNSMKMKRRKAQAKKKARLKRKVEAGKAAASATAKKTTKKSKS